MEEKEIIINCSLLTDNFYRDYKKLIKPVVKEMHNLIQRFDSINEKMTVQVLTKFESELWKLRHIIQIHKINLEVYKNQIELFRYYESLKEEHNDTNSEIELKKSLIVKTYASWCTSRNYIRIWIECIEKELIINK